ncbi:MAG TPA: MBG domain-containing protein, partial [Patescibacteria group bacterium]|nr:MBG domain-containing protein [Patescibacteria group bacterium]
PYSITQGTLNANANYSVNFIASTLLIAPAPLSVIADSKTKVQGQADPVFTATYQGLVNSETPAVLSGSLVLTRAPGEAAGTYPVTPSGLSSVNYSISFVPATLTITALPIQPMSTISILNETDLLLSWTAVSNVTYRVQYKSDLNSTFWIDLPGDVVATSSTASRTDTRAAGNRFYRIRVLP